MMKITNKTNSYIWVQEQRISSSGSKCEHLRTLAESWPALAQPRHFVRTGPRVSGGKQRALVVWQVRRVEGRQEHFHTVSEKPPLSTECSRWPLHYAQSFTNRLSDLNVSAGSEMYSRDDVPNTQAD